VQHLGRGGRSGQGQGRLRAQFPPAEGSRPTRRPRPIRRRCAYEGATHRKQRAAEKGAARDGGRPHRGEVHLSFAVKVGEEDKLYGSVTASDVQRKLEELGIRVDKAPGGPPRADSRAGRVPRRYQAASRRAPGDPGQRGEGIAAGRTEQTGDRLRYEYRRSGVRTGGTCWGRGRTHRPPSGWSRRRSPTARRSTPRCSISGA